MGLGFLFSAHVSTSRASSIVFGFLTLTLVLGASTARAHSHGVVPPPPQENSSSERLWITVGADAFEMLANDDLLRIAGEPLTLHGEKSAVVMTQIRADQVDYISGLMHQYFRRCGGFIVHPDRRQAEKALAGPTQSKFSRIDYQLDQQATVQALQPMIQESNILNTIESLATDFNNRYYTTPSGRAAAVWIRDLWLGYAAGRDDVTVELFEHSWTQPSVIMTITGTESPEQLVIAGGHLDSTVVLPPDGSDFLAPGADDNASGIAALSEAVRVLLSEGFRPQRTLQIMGYAAEEVGLLGSAAIATQYSNENRNVVSVLQLDMTAFKGSSEDIAFLSDFTNPTLSAFGGQLVDVYQPNLVRTSTACGYGCSDHASWTQRGFPAMMAFEARFGQHNDLIHSTEDTLATVNNSATHSAKFSRLALAYLVEVGSDFSPVIFKNGFESGDLTAWSSSSSR